MIKTHSLSVCTAAAMERLSTVYFTPNLASLGFELQGAMNTITLKNNNMIQTEYYQELPVHFLNLINAYHSYQYEDLYQYKSRSLESTLAHDNCIYEFTGLLK